MKILIIRFSSIGDIVLTTPVLRCLKKQLHNCELHYVTKTQHAPILQQNPYIDKIHSWEEGFAKSIKNLKKENFDLVIDLHNNFRTFLVKLLLFKKNKTFVKLNFKKWLLVYFKINYLPTIHIVDRYMNALQDLGIKNDGEGLDYFIKEEEKVNTEKLYGVKENEFICFAIGGTFATKKLPAPKIIEVCNQLNFPVILIGDKNDSVIAQTILNATHGNIINACAQLSINQSASVVQQAKLVLAHDTGMMHIAAAFKRPVISIWGNTIPQFGMTPYYGQQKNQSHIVEVKNLSCRPCSKLGFDKCPRGHFDCMNKIEVEEIIHHSKLIVTH